MAQTAPSPPPAEPRGPVETREEWILAQPHLTLPALAPDPLADGATRVRVDFDWGNDFGRRLRYADDFEDLRYIVDGEHCTLALDVRHGMTPSLTLGVRLPVRWRGGGILDGVIDWWHSLLSVPTNERERFPRGAFRVEGGTGGEPPLDWDSRTGTGLGRTELSAQWAFSRARAGWRTAAVVRVALPTGTGPFASGGVDAGLQVLAAHRLGSAFDVYLGVGGTLFGDPHDDALEYATLRPHGFFVLEWRPAARWSLTAETSAAGQLVRNLDGYVPSHVYLKIGSKVDVSRRWRVEGGFVEGLTDQQTTTDFGVFAAVSRRF